MTDPTTHINYTFEDIQRYLQRKMSPAEMHDMEKASLQDSFLADAIEGYTNVSETTAKQHLNEINASLFIEKQKSKVVAFHKRTRWLNIAAMLILIAGVGFLSVYFLKNSKEESEIAQEKNQAPETKVLNDSATATNNGLFSKKDTALFIAENKSSKKEKASAGQLMKRKIIATDENKIEENISTIAAAPVQQNGAASGYSNADIAINKVDSSPYSLQGKTSTLYVLTNTFSGKVVDENNKPIPYVTIESADKETAVVTDLNGDFSINKNDSIMNVTASTIGYDSKNANLKSGYNTPIILQGSGTALNDVVVVGYGANKKAKPVTQTPEPIGGWENFNNYVLSKLNKDSVNENFIPYNDLVEIEFLIDKAGNPYDFKIVRPLDEQRDAKAIEILRSGPKWTNTSKKKKARVTISF